MDLVFISDCVGDGSEHLRWAAPGLEKGVPTFVDKPFAYDVKAGDMLAKIEREYMCFPYSLARSI